MQPGIMGVHHNGLPTFFDHTSGKWRILGVKRSSRPKLKVETFAQFMKSRGEPPDLLSSIPDYDRFQTNVPILDQQQVGSCVAHGHTSAVLKARDISGATYVPLSADSLYAYIDNGVDEGSDPADAITALQQTGICTLADVPDNFILAANIPAAAVTNALRFRIVPTGVYSCATFAQLVTADWLGFATTLTINVGDNFNPDSTGVVGYTSGVANHCVSGGEAKRTVNGVAQYRFRNSWNTSWGINGCAWFPAKTIDSQPQGEYYAIQWTILDPLDPLNGPLS
jgi:Papain family cysteine protease